MTDAHIQSPPVVAVSNLIKQFGRFAALRGVTAEFSGSKLYAILGDNGAGKTTLLRTLAGLNRPTSGQVTILGASILNSRVRSGNIRKACGNECRWHARC